eukprot:g6147.t1
MALWGPSRARKSSGFVRFGAATEATTNAASAIAGRASLEAMVVQSVDDLQLVATFHRSYVSACFIQPVSTEDL